MRRLKPLALLGLGVFLAFIVSVLAYNWLQQQGKKARVGQIETSAAETQLVAVAAHDLLQGINLTPEMITLVSYPRKSLPKGFFSNIEHLVGRVLIQELKTHEPILESKFASAGVTAGGIALRLKPGKRAMAVKVNERTGVAGFINPGNRVDVLVTIRGVEQNTAGDRPKSISKIVLENIPVLATGKEIESKESVEKPQVVNVVTLEVTPEESEKLSLAVCEGEICLALRNPLDSGVVGVTEGAKLENLLEPPMKKEVVELISGEKMDKVIFRFPAEGNKSKNEKQ